MIVNIVSEDYTGHVHDNEILSYVVDIRNKTLTLYTEWHGRTGEVDEETVIIFSGLLSHCFDDVNTIQNVIFGIEEISLEGFLNICEKRHGQKAQDAIPIYVNGGLDALTATFTERCYKVFEIDSAVGLRGYAIAKNIEIIVEKKDKGE